MRGLTALLLTAVVCVGCANGSPPQASPTTGKAAISLESLGVDWPAAGDEVDPPKLPAVPGGISEELIGRMAGILTTWATAAALDDGVWHGADPLATVSAALPKTASAMLRKQVKGEVSPHLAVANVFASDVTIVGVPRITSAWKLSKAKDDSGRPYARLELQTRTAYEVRLGSEPSRVIGLLRVHGLTAYPDTTDDFGVAGGWQEFGAGDCSLALDDALRPDSDLDQAAEDLATFVKVGDSAKLRMPPLGVQEQVDAEYLKRCREGQV
ncbi:hypothetical protein [Aeromicrobium sp.]|uniref:hypothetical protein n=1 Tax=Aeromicrobium sp. TaxID=1871063 RepID=UPI003C6B1D04